MPEQQPGDPQPYTAWMRVEAGIVGLSMLFGSYKTFENARHVGDHVLGTVLAIGGVAFVSMIRKGES